MPSSIKHSLQRDPESALANQDATVYGGIAYTSGSCSCPLTLNTLAKDILKPVINKCLKDTSIQAHMFSLLCATMGVPHQLSSSSGFLQPP